MRKTLGEDCRVLYDLPDRVPLSRLAGPRFDGRRQWHFNHVSESQRSLQFYGDVEIGVDVKFSCCLNDQEESRVGQI